MGTSTNFRRFRLRRHVDASGVSGTGLVAEGVQFSDGHCAMRWLTDTASVAIYDSITDLEAIHGHEGATVIEWVDQGHPGHVNFKLKPKEQTLEDLIVSKVDGLLEEWLKRASKLV